MGRRRRPGYSNRSFELSNRDLNQIKLWLKQLDQPKKKLTINDWKECALKLGFSDNQLADATLMLSNSYGNETIQMILDNWTMKKNKNPTVDIALNASQNFETEKATSNPSIANGKQAIDHDTQKHYNKKFSDEETVPSSAVIVDDMKISTIKVPISTDEGEKEIKNLSNIFYDEKRSTLSGGIVLTENPAEELESDRASSIGSYELPSEEDEDEVQFSEDSDDSIGLSAAKLAKRRRSANSETNTKSSIDSLLSIDNQELHRQISTLETPQNGLALLKTVIEVALRPSKRTCLNKKV